MKFIISGPWLSVYQRGYVIEYGLVGGGFLELLVIGEFKGQVVSVPDTWINRALVWWLDIHFGIDSDQLSRVP